MKITKIGLLSVLIMVGTMGAMDKPNPEGTPGYPYQYHYGQYPYNPPIDYSGEQPYGYGYYPYQGQPAGYTNPYYGHHNPAVPMPYAYPTQPYYAMPAEAQPVAVPAAASVNDQTSHAASDNDDDITSITSMQPSAAVSDVITDQEQEHLDKLVDNLKKITDAVLGVAASYAGAGVNLATLQLGEAAGEAILATAGNVKDAGQIAWWLSRASHHFDALSKPGVSKAAQVERDKLAPTLKAFKKKFSGSPIKAIKNKFFEKKEKSDDTQK